MACSDKKLINGVGYVNCGKCYNCKKQKAMEWTYRLMCQLSSTPNALFLTLTYSDDYYITPSLDYRDYQNFIKRVRKAIPDRKIKYFCCGEYGEQTFRKHFHAIVFNVGWSDEKIIRDEWFLGNVDIAPVESGSIGYVVGYMDKKLEYSFIDYDDLGYREPKHLCSRGLGEDFLFKNYDILRYRKYGIYNGQKFPLSRYFRERLNLTMLDSEYSEFLDTLDPLEDFDIYKTSIDYKTGKTGENLVFAKDMIEHLKNTRDYAKECQIKTKTKLNKRSSI